MINSFTVKNSFASIALLSYYTCTKYIAFVQVSTCHYYYYGLTFIIIYVQYSHYLYSHSICMS